MILTDWAPSARMRNVTLLSGLIRGYCAAGTLDGAGTPASCAYAAQNPKAARARVRASCLTSVSCIVGILWWLELFCRQLDNTGYRRFSQRDSALHRAIPHPPNPGFAPVQPDPRSF